MDSTASRAVTSDGRQIAPIGTATRVVGGLAAIVVAIAVSGITWWDVGAALFALPLTAALAASAITAIHRGRRPTGDAEPTPTESWLRSLVVLVVVIAVEVALTFVTPLDGAVAVWLFIGVSLLIAALRGDGGCEATAIPNALAGRRDRVGCVIYAPIDAIEARRPRGSILERRA
jgi:hypothetical protein